MGIVVHSQENRYQQMNHWQKLIFYLLPFTFSLLICTLPIYAQQQIQTTCSQKFVNSKCVSKWKEIIPELTKAQVVYLGETHDSSQDHQNQLKIIQELHQNSPKIAIAMEMFQRPYQEVINQYLAGKLTEEELVKKSEYEKRWGFPWEYYAPILRFAKEKKMPVLALNTPSEITRKVARTGWESLTVDEKKFIPPLAEINTDNQEYRQLALAAFQHHQAGGHGNSVSADRFFLAQVLWDETMASGIAKFVKENPDYQVIVLAGSGHIVYGYGIPSRVERRLKSKKNFIQRSILLSPPLDAVPKNKQIADFILNKTQNN
ncbi:MAG: ChaN family lipoprotein [Nostocaceae cyanobacterium]|nr:ChaN family lipoprotein [Nostocaceae cyanobacterium]